MVDASDASASEGVMIAFLPTNGEWCKQELPHMTLVYAGVISDLGPASFSALVKDAAMIAMLFRPFSLNVTHLDVFGDEEKVDVLRFQLTPELRAARRLVDKWNKSQHSFKPHATIGPVNPMIDPLNYPRVLGFDQIMVGWGDESVVFKL